MNLGRVFQPNKRRQKREDGASPTGSASSHSATSLERQRTPRLERCNATKKVNYCVADLDGCSSGTADGGGDAAQLTRYLEVLPDELLLVQFAGQTSFRISGEVDGEFEALCHSLGLSGPDDFGITPGDWAMSGSTAANGLCANEVDPDVDVFSRPHMEEPLTLPPLLETPAKADDLGSMTTETFRFAVAPAGDSSHVMNSLRKGNGGGRIKGARPAMLAPPPPISIPFVNDRSSTWDILRSLAPDETNESGPATYWREMSSEEDEAEKQVTEDLLGGNAEFEEVKGIRMGETSMDLKASCSWTSIDDDSSSTTTEGTYVISPVGKLKRNIESWRKGHELGSGSFGTVYEAISDDGFFFAVKEVSLVNEGMNARQCINQLEQEIALLSQFEHENIVQYLGTAKLESKLCIFLELVSQGSLASLYQKYHLRDSHVSAYTRQILNGLKYLHDRNVVHRDIKCANILVDANGSVKLADFGLAKEITKFNALKSCKGSVYWMAPEVVKARRNYGNSADIWSLGCTVLEMLTRQHPFPNLEWTHAFFLIGQGRRPPVPKSLSQDARDFIEQCTQVEPDRRPSASKLLDHPFVKRLLPTSRSASSPMDNSSRGT